MRNERTATFFAILAAALYAINIPLSKLLLVQVPPAMMAAFLYLGAGAGMFAICRICREKPAPVAKKEWIYLVGMVLLDIAAPILLMLGLERTGSANASLINNFEIVATSLIAFFVFREKLSGRLAAAVICVCAASVILSFEGRDSLEFNTGSLLVLAAACCWGLENNCTRMLSHRSSVQLTAIKGLCSGTGSLLVALMAGERFPGIQWIGCVLLLGFVAYGLSINFYIRAQKDLGAAKTSAYYSVAPFMGVIFGMVFLRERPGWQFYVGLAVMVAATVLLVRDTVGLQHTHDHIHVHTHAHAHGDLIHTHEHIHSHSHLHTHDREEVGHSHNHDRFSDHEHSHESAALE